MRVVWKIASTALPMPRRASRQETLTRGPCRRRAGHDSPVDLMTRNQLERRPVCLRDGAIRSPSFIGILIRPEQVRIAAGDRQPCCAALEGRAHSVVQPLGRVITEAFIRSKMVSHQSRFIVAVESCDQRSAGAVGPCSVMRRASGSASSDAVITSSCPAHQAEPDPHCDLSQQVQFLFVRTFFSVNTASLMFLFPSSSIPF